MEPMTRDLSWTGYVEPWVSLLPKLQPWRNPLASLCLLPTSAGLGLPVPVPRAGVLTLPVLK